MITKPKAKNIVERELKTKANSFPPSPTPS